MKNINTGKWVAIIISCIITIACWWLLKHWVIKVFISMVVAIMIWFLIEDANVPTELNSEYDDETERHIGDKWHEDDMPEYIKNRDRFPW